MAQSRGAAVAAQEFTADEQAQFDAMRTGDGATADDARDQSAASTAESGQSQQQNADALVTDVGDEPTGSATTPQTQTVPHGALHAERELHKLTKQQLADLQKNYDTLNERTNAILQRFAQPPAQQATAAIRQPELPDLAADPIGHFTEMMRRQGETIQELTSALQQRQSVDQNMVAISGLQNQAMAAEREFATGTPDYYQAVQHLQGFRHRQLAELGYDASQRQAMISQEALGIAARAINMGRNPAATLYALAKQTGYQQAPDKPASADGGNDAPSPASRLAAVAAGQQQGRGLGAARGAGPRALTAERLLEMSPDEFVRAIQTADGRAILGA